jgi:hypothetical protein
VSSETIAPGGEYNLGEKGGGKRYLELPQFEMALRVEKIKLYPIISYLVYWAEICEPLG